MIGMSVRLQTQWELEISTRMAKRKPCLPVQALRSPTCALSLTGISRGDAVFAFNNCAVTYNLCAACVR